MLRAVFDVNGSVIAAAYARNTLHRKGGQTCYRAAYTIFDTDKMYLGQVYHTYSDGAGALIQRVIDLIIDTEPVPFNDDELTEFINSPYEEE
jgi:hypothetical protein